MSHSITTRTHQRYPLTATNTVVTFATRHLFGLGTVTGSMAVIAGLVTVDDVDDILIGIEADLDAAGFTTGSKARDAAVTSRRFLDAAAHPVVRFRSHRVERDGHDRLVHGELSVRGIVAPVDLRLSGVESGTTLTIRGVARVDRYAHGMTAGRGLAARHLDIGITTTATRGEHE